MHPGPSEGLHRVVFVPDQSGPYKVNLFVDGVASNVDVTVNVVKIEADRKDTVEQGETRWFRSGDLASTQLGVYSHFQKTANRRGNNSQKSGSGCCRHR